MITITQGGIDFPPRVTIERTAKGEIVYAVTVPDKSVERARKRAEQTFLALKRFAEGLGARPDELLTSPAIAKMAEEVKHSLAEQVKRADELVAELAEPAARRRRGRPRKAEQLMEESP